MTSTPTISSVAGRPPARRSGFTRVVLGAGVTLAMAFGAVACGNDDDSAAESGVASDEASREPGVASAAIGEQLSRSQGCAGCHGRDFGGGAGPTWIGLAGSEVLLADGTTVIADDEYLITAIADPSAQLVDGYTLRMPANNLTDAEIADIVAYINTLADG
jgi:cytochrome c oxidase subunit 2